jgi:hypothetical protein
MPRIDIRQSRKMLTDSERCCISGWIERNIEYQNIRTPETCPEGSGGEFRNQKSDGKTRLSRGS